MPKLKDTKLPLGLEIVLELWELAKAHKRWATVIILFELWLHSLVVHHLEELKSFTDLIPFAKYIFGN